MFRALDAEKIIATLDRLSRRIRERFPTGSLGNVADELLQVAKKAAVRSEAISKPNLGLRLGILLLLASFAALVTLTIKNLDMKVELKEAGAMLQAIESILNELVYIGAAVWFLFSLENRMKRRRALDALHELRAFAHIVDMHQLTKDPEVVLNPGKSTPSSPVRDLTPYELSRYLDYCSEMLALMGKIAALYVQRFQDAVALEAVDDIESLTTGISSKVWQKIAALDRAPSGS